MERRRSSRESVVPDDGERERERKRKREKERERKGEGKRREEKTREGRRREGERRVLRLPDMRKLLVPRSASRTTSNANEEQQRSRETEISASKKYGVTK
ncbi:hypothetical protein ANTRET_LOCUS5620 [Anthophora retusa]